MILIPQPFSYWLFVFYFVTPKKMGAQTAEANINAGITAAKQIVDFFVNGNTRFQVNK